MLDLYYVHFPGTELLKCVFFLFIFCLSSDTPPAHGEPEFHVLSDDGIKAFSGMRNINKGGEKLTNKRKQLLWWTYSILYHSNVWSEGIDYYYYFFF